MTPYLRAKICTWNCLRRKIHQNWQEQINACCEATEAVNKTKTESWKGFLQNAMSNSDGQNMWKVMQGVNSTPGANSPDKAMTQNGCTITNSKSKANVFINHYSRVSKLNMSRADEDFNCQFKKQLNAPSADNESCALFQCVRYFLPSKRWSAKEHLVLTTLHLHFSSHLDLWPSRNCYPYLTHYFLLFIVYIPGGLPLLFHYWKLGNLLVNLLLFALSVFHHVLSNFWKVFLMIVFNILLKPKICSANSKPDFIKVGAAKIRLLG